MAQWKCNSRKQKEKEKFDVHVKCSLPLVETMGAIECPLVLGLRRVLSAFSVFPFGSIKIYTGKCQLIYFCKHDN